METRSKPKILVVDDDPAHLDIVSNLLVNDYIISVTTCGNDAIKIATEQSFDAIILDVVMPEVDGYEVCSQLLSLDDFFTPIVFLTSNDSPEQIERGLELGATYYLTKPINPKRLLAVIRTATDHTRFILDAEQKYHTAINTLGLMQNATFAFKTLDEARALATLASRITPAPENAFIGLSELMINAIEHGNLGITYDEKSQLNEEGKWQETVEKRLLAPVNKHKAATLQINVTEEFVSYLVTDEGPGFEWQKYLKFDPDRALDSHGRGIAMANVMCFDQLEYQGNGNQVLASIRLTK